MSILRKLKINKIAILTNGNSPATGFEFIIKKSVAGVTPLFTDMSRELEELYKEAPSELIEALKTLAKYQDDFPLELRDSLKRIVEAALKPKEDYGKKPKQDYGYGYPEEKPEHTIDGEHVRKSCTPLKNFVIGLIANANPQVAEHWLQDRSGGKDDEDEEKLLIKAGPARGLQRGIKGQDDFGDYGEDFEEQKKLWPSL